MGYEYKMEKTEVQIVTEFVEKTEELEVIMIDADAQFLPTHEEMKEMEVTRTEENGQFQQATSDDQAATELLRQAVEHQASRRRLA